MSEHAEQRIKGTEELSTKSSTTPGMLDYLGPAPYPFSHNVGRCLRADELPPFDQFLQRVGAIALKERLSAHILAKPEDIFASISRQEQIQAAARTMREALPEALSTIMDYVFFTRQRDDSDMVYKGLKFTVSRRSTRLVLQMTGSHLAANRTELAGALAKIPDVPYYATDQGAPPVGITMARFDEPPSPDVTAQIMDTSEIDRWPSIGKTIWTGPVEIIDLTVMQNRIIRPDPDFIAQ